MLFLKALFGLLAYDIFNIFRPFRALYSYARKFKVAAVPAGHHTTDHICTAINYACAWYPKQARCLQRSFVTARLLRKYGIAAEIVLGAQKLPFSAHAWVEVNGRVVNESSNVQLTYSVWDRC
jgi:hypothetical protein